MRTSLALVVLLLMVEAFSQQAKPRPLPHTDVGVLVHGNDPTGEIHGIVIHDGTPAKGISVTAHWLCPEGCFNMASTVITNQVGEYRFGPITFGRYSVFVGNVLDLLSLPRSAGLLKYEKVELSPNHPDAEVEFEINDRAPHKNGK